MESKAQRPVAATVFGILNIVFGVLGLIGLAFSTLVVFMPIDPNVPVSKLVHGSGAYALFLKASLLLGGVATIALLAAGIGLLMMKPWARKLSIAYAVYAIVAGVAGLVMNYLFMFVPLMEAAREQQGPEAAGAIGGAIGGMVGGVFGLIYPVVLLFFMMRPNMVAAFAAKEHGDQLFSA